MPLTLSHPAAVLPLLHGLRARGPLVASALVAGSMAPDVPFYAESWLPGVYRYGALTHRWWAVPTVDVALAGVLLAGWHGAARPPLLRLLAEPWADAAQAATAPRPSAGRRTRQVGREAGAFALSAAIGAATHVGWDAFTHHGRGGVRLLPALNREVAGVPLYTVLQYGTSVLGLGYLARYLAGELRQMPASPVGVPAAAAARMPAAPRADGGRADAVRVDGARRGRLVARVVIGVSAALGAGRRITRSADVRGPGQRRDPIADLCFGAGAGAAAGAFALAAAAAAGWGVEARSS